VVRFEKILNIVLSYVFRDWFLFLSKNISCLRIFALDVIGEMEFILIVFFLKLEI